MQMAKHVSCVIITNMVVSLLTVSSAIFLYVR